MANWCINKFCYLGNVMGSGGGAEEASKERVQCAWGQVQRNGTNFNIKRYIPKGERKGVQCIPEVGIGKHGSSAWQMT
jgi:hypothetical protein